MTLQQAFDQLVLGMRLGPRHVLAVLRYRQRKRRSHFEKKFPARDAAGAKPFWSGAGANPALAVAAPLRAAILARADEICRGEFRRFGDKLVTEGEYPAWFKGGYAASAAQHFSRVAINETPGDDVKLTWDLSRFHWATELALAASVSEGKARAKYLDRLYQLTTDWLATNGYHRGANWACAQEVSVRALQLMLTTHLLHQHVGLRPSTQLLELLSESWRRTDAVRGYSLAQQNNHSLTEHLFLLYGAAFLGHYETPIASSGTINALRSRVQQLLQHLILPDGGTSMYSTNYHRVFCDMVSFARIFDDLYNVGTFTAPAVQQRVEKLAAFLAAIIEPISGKVPLIGHNDGSLHALQYAPFQQFEPSLLLLSAAFQLPVSERTKRVADAVWLFGYTPCYTSVIDAIAEQQFDAFGLIIHQTERYRAYIKYPRNRFRPSQLDFLHLDLWVGGENLLTDSGTYSYNPAIAIREGGLAEPEAHSVPLRLRNDLLQKQSPFLYRYWPNAKLRHGAIGTWDLQVENDSGMALHRRVMFEPARIVLRDRVHDTQPWGMAMNGAIHEGRGNMLLLLADRCKITFLNVQHFSLSDTVRADNYQSLVPSFRLLTEPMVTARPITTMIEVVK